ncbi:MAG: flagellar basal-body rod protein FlgG [Ignavibacteriales bacterium]|nr:flagellar basal-body rod protein FlgG [Ignavibacteriales bacterium]
MLRALTTAATGMIAQQVNLDVIANNLANVNTTGYKKVRAEFQDLLSQTLKAPGAQGAQGTNQPVGIQIGLGVRTAATERVTTAGALKSTGNPLDVAIEGDGYFQVQMDDGNTAYTRDGSFKIDASGQLTTSDGYVIQPQITIPQNATDVTITPDGRVSVKTAGDAASTEVGAIQLAQFVNPSGLIAAGKNLFLESSASGDPVQGEGGQDGFGTIQQGFLESSNVQVVEELISMIQAERAFEVNSKAITSSDSMLKTVNRLV